MRALGMTIVSVVLLAASGVAATAQDDPKARPPIPSEGCGTSEVAPGSHRGSMTVGEVGRSWLLRVPTAYDGEKPLPLVILFHGGLEDAASILSRTGFSRLGEEEGFIVVAPQDDAYPSMWMWEPTDPAPDLALSDPDIAFVDALYERLGADLCLDLGRIYATGESNGGSASSILGCMMDDRIAAIAPVAMAMEPGLACGSNRPVPVLAFQASTTTPYSWTVDGATGSWTRCWTMGHVLVIARTSTGAATRSRSRIAWAASPDVTAASRTCCLR